MSIVHTADGSVETVASGFGWPYRILITPDQRTVIIPDLRGHVVRVFDREDRSERGAIELPGTGPQGVTLYRDPNLLFISLSQQDRVAVIDLESLEVVGYYPAGSSPDGIGYSSLRLAR